MREQAVQKVHVRKGRELFLLVCIVWSLAGNQDRRISIGWIHAFSYSQKKQMKLRLFLILLFLATLSAYADNARIIISQKSGNKFFLDLETNPVITFSDENMVIKNDFTTISIPLADVDIYTVNNGTTGIEQVDIGRQYSNGHVVFSGIPAGVCASVYTMDGRSVCSQRVDTSGIVDINLNSLPKGTYIINVQRTSIKVTNK